MPIKFKTDQPPIGLMSETRSMPITKTFSEFARQADYSLMNSLEADPHSTLDGNDHIPREVVSGHYVPVTPTAIPEPEYVAHSIKLFNELGLCHELILDELFRRLFSGDIKVAQAPMRKVGWATGYALSIYGTEYTQQCPFGTGNGYGDGRAISIFEGLFNGERWEMQLKGGGPTPYCRGADGRAVLRSSVREFLAQDYMQSLGVPTSRSLTLYVSRSETVRRPWYSKDTNSLNPDILVDTPAAISTRVAPSFLRVGQIELFARRVRNNEHKNALRELEMIVKHLIARNYKKEIDPTLSFSNQVVELSNLFMERLTSLVANWIRIGYCQGNFNSDNCAAGGFTLDYGPFGFCELFDPRFQPWTGGGEHFAFLNQQVAAELNYQMFCDALKPLLTDNEEAQERLSSIRDEFTLVMNRKMENMWTKKLGLIKYEAPLVTEMLQLMVDTKIDYTMFFRKLSNIPSKLEDIKDSFYIPSSEHIDNKWISWLKRWRESISDKGGQNEKAKEMKSINPKYTWREWLITPAYEKAEEGDYSLIKELQAVLDRPYEEQSSEVQRKYDILKPEKFFRAGGISHYSCSS